MLRIILVGKKKLKSISEGQGIEMHILDEPPVKIINSPGGQKISWDYIDWKKHDSLIKVGFKELSLKKFYFLSADWCGNP